MASVSESLYEVTPQDTIGSVCPRCQHHTVVASYLYIAGIQYTYLLCTWEDADDTTPCGWGIRL